MKSKFWYHLIEQLFFSLFSSLQNLWVGCLLRALYVQSRKELERQVADEEEEELQRFRVSPQNPPSFSIQKLEKSPMRIVLGPKPVNQADPSFRAFSSSP